MRIQDCRSAYVQPPVAVWVECPTSTVVCELRFTYLGACLLLVAKVRGAVCGVPSDAKALRCCHILHKHRCAHHDTVHTSVQVGTCAHVRSDDCDVMVTCCVCVCVCVCLSVCLSVRLTCSGHVSSLQHFQVVRSLKGVSKRVESNKAHVLGPNRVDKVQTSKRRQSEHLSTGRCLQYARSPTAKSTALLCISTVLRHMQCPHCTTQTLTAAQKSSAQSSHTRCTSEKFQMWLAKFAHEVTGVTAELKPFCSALAAASICVSAEALHPTNVCTQGILFQTVTQASITEGDNAHSGVCLKSWLRSHLLLSAAASAALSTAHNDRPHARQVRTNGKRRTSGLARMTRPADCKARRFRGRVPGWWLCVTKCSKPGDQLLGCTVPLPSVGMRGAKCC